MRIIGKIIAVIRAELLVRKIQREVHRKMIPHLMGRANYGYPFKSKAELHKVRLESSLRLQCTIGDITMAAMASMSEAECNAFLNAVHRDLESRAHLFITYARSRRNEKDEQASSFLPAMPEAMS